MRFARLRSALRGWRLRRANRGRFEHEFLPALPKPFAPAARWIYDRDWTAEERRLAREIEEFRGRIAEIAPARIESLPSPHSGTFELDALGRSRGAAPASAPSSAHARTGVDAAGGVLLRRLVDGLGARRVLELGTNTGFSGCWFLSAHARPTVVSVEGSADLCEIARRNLARVSRDFVVLHRLFDDAIDELAATAERFDCVFLDGQHERRATLHYAERVRPLLAPGAVLVFDDVYWSEDMNQAWQDLCGSDAYSLSVDFGWKGVVVTGGAGPKRHFDLCELIGRPRIARPGW